MMAGLTAEQEAAIPATVRWRCVHCDLTVLKHDDRMRARLGVASPPVVVGGVTVSRRMLYCMNCGESCDFQTREIKHHG